MKERLVVGTHVNCTVRQLFYRNDCVQEIKSQR
jgi:hypothetical protein